MLKRLSIILMTVVSLCMADVNLAGVTVSEPLFAYTPFPMGNLPSRYSKKDHPKYAYAPATVFFNGKYHQFYCSNGSDSDHFYPLKAKGNDPWDHVRYRSSKDGVNWSGPKVAMSVNNNFYERASVVYGDDGYWYMLYTGNLDGYETVVFLARANYIQGPYFKYTTNGKWENEAGHASNPKVVLSAKAAKKSYGVGQQTVVKSPGGGYWVWFNSSLERGKRTIRFVYTTDLTKLDYSKSVEIQGYVGTGMIPSSKMGCDIGDVRLDTDTGILYMWCLDGGYMTENPRLVKLSSTDGINWYPPIDPKSAETQEKYSYNFIHNMGVAGDRHGWISGGKYLISFAAPSPKGAESNNANVALKYSISELKNYGFNIEEHRRGDEDMKGYWSMWQLLVGDTWKEDRVYYPSDGFEFPKDVKSTDITYFTGDYDGDGVSDLGAVNRSTKKWYIYSSRQGCYIDWKGKCRSKYSTIKKCYVNNNDKCVQVYGEKLIDKVYNAKGELTGDFTFKDFEVIAGDFDGDGKTDIGAVDKNLGRWYIYSSADQRKGIYSSLTEPNLSYTKPNYIPWGWKWAGMNSSHKIVVGDYNGDGFADRAIYDHQEKAGLVRWYIISSAALEKDVDKGFYDVYAAAFFPFGWTWAGSNVNHDAISGDFDGDGITDRAIYGIWKWYSLSSRIGESKIKRIWGKRLTEDGGTVAVVGDYDGDGADDMVNVNRSEGKWYIYSSEYNSIATLTWKSLKDVMKAGNVNAKEVEILSGDFDGDHKADPAFVDKTTRTFYVMSSRKNADGVDSKIKSIPRNPNNLIYFAKKGDDPIDDKKPVAPATIKAPAMNVAVDGKKVSVTNVEYGSKVAVFDMLGKKILETAAGEKSANFEVPSYGKYIVRAGAQSRVIMVK